MRAVRASLHRGARRGMNLLEVMVALAIILVLVFMGLQAIDNALELRDLLQQRDEVTRTARTTMGKLRRELQLAFLTEHRDAIEQYETVFVGLDEDPDRLYFATFAHQRLYRDTRQSDQAEVTIWAEPSSGDDLGYILYHRESDRIDEEPDEGGRILPLARQVRSFELRYLDAQQDEWRDEWDTRSTDTPNRLPRAVQIGLTLIGQDPEDPDRTVDVPFVTTVILQYAQGYQRGLPLGMGVSTGQPGSRGGPGVRRPGRRGPKGRAGRVPGGPRAGARPPGRRLPGRGGRQ